jgi:pSer/pThr/pTyr-binding forkhead associated (FHA) protein
VSEAQLSILNYALLALIYLFFARVLWAVWSEVRGPRLGTAPAAHVAGDAGAPAERSMAATKPSRTKRGVPTKLVVLEPKVRKGAAYPIGQEITVGRAATCSISVPDDTFASQLHARVFVSEGAVRAEDLASTNGTHLNGAKLTAPVQLSTGDRLQVGSTIFEAQ